MNNSARIGVQAHRGNQQHEKENTLAAFAAAVDFADGIEMDVQITEDLIPVIYHDFAIDTASGYKLIKNIKFEDLKNLDAGKDVPTLSQVISWFKKHHQNVSSTLYLNIELKRDPTKPHQSHDIETISTLVLQEVAEFIATDKIMFCSFDPSLLICLRKKQPMLKLAYLFDQGVISLIQSTYKCDAIGHILHFAKHAAIDILSVESVILQNKKIAKRLRDAGMNLFSWTINDPQGWTKAIKESINTIITDVPENLYQFLKEKDTTISKKKNYNINFLLSTKIARRFFK